RDAGTVSDVLYPSSFGGCCRLDHLEIFVSKVFETVTDPINVLLNRNGHIGEHRRTTGSSDGKEVWKAGHHQAEICSRPICPLLTQREAVATSDVDGDDWAGHCVEPGGVNDGVELK